MLGKPTLRTSHDLRKIFFQNPSDSQRVFSEQNEEFLQGSRNVILNLYSLTLRKLWQILQQRHEPETDDFFWEPDRFEPTEQYVSNVNVIAVFSHFSCPYISNQCLKSPKSNAFEMLWFDVFQQGFPQRKWELCRINWRRKKITHIINIIFFPLHFRYRKVFSGSPRSLQ